MTRPEAWKTMKRASKLLGILVLLASASQAQVPGMAPGMGMGMPGMMGPGMMGGMPGMMPPMGGVGGK